MKHVAVKDMDETSKKSKTSVPRSRKVSTSFDCPAIKCEGKGRSARSAATATAAVRASLSSVEKQTPQPMVYEGIGSTSARQSKSNDSSVGVAAAPSSVTSSACSSVVSTANSCTHAQQASIPVDSTQSYALETQTYTQDQVRQSAVQSAQTFHSTQFLQAAPTVQAVSSKSFDSSDSGALSNNLALTEGHAQSKGYARSNAFAQSEAEDGFMPRNDTQSEDGVQSEDSISHELVSDSLLKQASHPSSVSSLSGTVNHDGMVRTKVLPESTKAVPSLESELTSPSSSMQAQVKGRDSQTVVNNATYVRAETKAQEDSTQNQAPAVGASALSELSLSTTNSLETLNSSKSDTDKTATSGQLPADCCPLNMTKLPSWQITGIIFSESSHIVAGLNAKSSQWVRPYKGANKNNAERAQYLKDVGQLNSDGSPQGYKQLAGAGADSVSQETGLRQENGLRPAGGSDRANQETGLRPVQMQPKITVISGSSCCLGGGSSVLSGETVKGEDIGRENVGSQQSSNPNSEAVTRKELAPSDVCNCEATETELQAKQEQVVYCPVEMSLSLLGGKYKSLILWKLLECGTLRFQQLRRLIPKATPKILTQQLRELEEHGLVRRMVYPVVPPKVEYSLTALGITIQPLLVAMYNWGSQYLKHLGHATNCTMTFTYPELPKINANVQSMDTLPEQSSSMRPQEGVHSTKDVVHTVTSGSDVKTSNDN